MCGACSAQLTLDSFEPRLQQMGTYSAYCQCSCHGCTTTGISATWHGEGTGGCLVHVGCADLSEVGTPCLGASEEALRFQSSTAELPASELCRQCCAKLAGDIATLNIKVFQASMAHNFDPQTTGQQTSLVLVAPTTTNTVLCPCCELLPYSSLQPPHFFPPFSSIYTPCFLCQSSMPSSGYSS